MQVQTGLADLYTRPPNYSIETHEAYGKICLCFPLTDGTVTKALSHYGKVQSGPRHDLFVFSNHLRHSSEDQSPGVF